MMVDNKEYETIAKSMAETVSTMINLTNNTRSCGVDYMAYLIFDELTPKSKDLIAAINELILIRG
jgi:hypothetical protein